MGFEYFFALLTGFAFAGFISSIWPLLGGRPVAFSLLMPASSLVALEVLVVTFSTPLLLLQLGIAQIRAGRHRLLGLGAVGGAVFSSFFQGVVVLTIVFNLS